MASPSPSPNKRDKDPLTMNDWVDAFEKYNSLVKTDPKLKQAAFLKSEASGPKFSIINKNRFSRQYKQWKNGQVHRSEMQRQRTRNYIDIETKLIEYIDARSRGYQQDKAGVITYNRIKVKCLHWATQAGYTDFKASRSWISKTLKRYGRENSIKIDQSDGKANNAELISEEVDALFGSFLVEFHGFLEEKNIRPECLYSADQSGLYYQKLPSTLYVNMEEKKKNQGCKFLKDEARITMMICTASNGDKVPIGVVGKSENPICFRGGNTPPLPYAAQKNAWFDIEAFRWWIDKVLIPYHLRKHGRNVPCCILLHNCIAHKLSDAEVELYERQNVFIKLLPPLITSKYLPANKGINTSLKVGYKTLYLCSLLDLFDEEGGYELAASRRKKQLPGCRGLAFGGKPTVLDAIEIIEKVWKADDKYSRMDAMKRCWETSNILPPSWKNPSNSNNNAAANKDSMSGPNNEKISRDDSDVICSMMKQMKIKATNFQVDTTTSAIALHQSFVSEPDIVNLSDNEWAEMISNWIDIEDDEDVINEEVDEAVECIDSGITEMERNETGGEDEAPDLAARLGEDSTPPEQPASKYQAMEALDIAIKYCREQGNEAALMLLNKAEKEILRQRGNRPAIFGFLPWQQKTK